MPFIPSLPVLNTPPMSPLCLPIGWAFPSWEGLHSLASKQFIILLAYSRHRSSILIGMASWLRDLFPEVTSRQRELHVPLQTQISGQKITTHTIQWITRRNYESMHAKYAHT